MKFDLNIFLFFKLHIGIYNKFCVQIHDIFSFTVFTATVAAPLHPGNTQFPSQTAAECGSESGEKSKSLFQIRLWFRDRSGKPLHVYGPAFLVRFVVVVVANFRFKEEQSGKSL
jgi:hypothetical protein